MEEDSEETRKARQEWKTPMDLFWLLNQEFQFDIDVAANAKNCLRFAYIDEERDALALGTRWFGQCDTAGMPTAVTRSAFCNPPYSDVTPWIEKAYEETETNPGSVAVLLLNYDVSTQWYELAKQRCYEIRAMSGGRVQFEPTSDCIKASSNSKPQCLLIFRKHPENLICVERSWSWRYFIDEDDDWPF